MAARMSAAARKPGLAAPTGWPAASGKPLRSPSHVRVAAIGRGGLRRIWPRGSAEGWQMASSDHSVGFEPADKLAQDRDSVRRRFWIKFKQVVARLPFAEELLAA